VRRGELRRYVRPSRPDEPAVVVILSSDGINESGRPWVLGVTLRSGDPDDLLAVPVAGYGWAYAGDISRLYRAWIGGTVGQIDTTTLRRIEGTLRAALDL
jgi:hypothetical protein